MSEVIIVSLISFAGTALGSFTGIRLITYRIEQLEKKVEKHNNLIERTYRLEERQSIAEEQIKNTNHRIDDLEGETEVLKKRN